MSDDTLFDRLKPYLPNGPYRYDSVDVPLKLLVGLIDRIEWLQAELGRIDETLGGDVLGLVPIELARGLVAQEQRLAVENEDLRADIEARIPGGNDAGS